MPFVPNPVTHTSLRLLEFEILRDLLMGYASSPLGQRRIAELGPSLDRAWIETQHQLAAEIGVAEPRALLATSEREISGIE